MEIANKIVSAVKAGIQELYGTEVSESMIQLQETRPEFEGQLTVVVFPFLKISRKKPEDTAQDLGTFLKTQIPEVIQDFNVIKGFLNLTIQPSQWIDLLLDIQQQEHFGFVPVTEDSPLVMIEYSSPNTNKPLHLGHVRNNLLGWALANVMQANGNKVVKTNIVNDRGIHICKSMLAWQYYGNGETPESSGKKGDHLIGDYYVAFDQHYREQVKELVEKGMDEETAKQEAPLIKEAHDMLVKWEQNDPEVRSLWKRMNDWVMPVSMKHTRPWALNLTKSTTKARPISKAGKRWKKDLKKDFSIVVKTALYGQTSLPKDWTRNCFCAATALLST